MPNPLHSCLESQGAMEPGGHCSGRIELITTEALAAAAAAEAFAASGFIMEPCGHLAYSDQPANFPYHKSRFASYKSMCSSLEWQFELPSQELFSLY